MCKHRYNKMMKYYFYTIDTKDAVINRTASVDDFSEIIIKYKGSNSAIICAIELSKEEFSKVKFSYDQ